MLTTTTLLGDWVTKFYKRLRIYHPKEINEEYICRQLRIFLKRKTAPASYEVVGRYQGINIDSRAAPDEQRIMFFHELCHILRHCGNQLLMPEMFRQLQEFDANNFARIAAIPNHMLNIDFNSIDIVAQMVEIFHVPSKIYEDRIYQIKSRVDVKMLLYENLYLL